MNILTDLKQKFFVGTTINTDITLSSYPRTGGNFFIINYLGMFKQPDGQPLVMEYDHCRENIGTKTVCVIREPEESITSFLTLIKIVKNFIINEETVTAAAELYIDFYKNIQDTNCVLIDFNDLSNYPNETFLEVGKIFCHQLSDKFVNKIPRDIDTESVKYLASSTRFEIYQDINRLIKDNKMLTECQRVYNDAIKYAIKITK